MKQVNFIVPTETLSKFSTLLQSGFYLEVDQGTSIGDLLYTLPGFSQKYVSSSVQTIFLNGLPADNLEQQLFGKDAVLAISAAMPGLAGAIFRKDGIHASLRTETSGDLSASKIDGLPVQVRLKFFNMIAMQRGVDVLANSCVVMTTALGKFFTYRPALLGEVHTIIVDGRDVEPQSLESLLESEKMISLTIRSQP